MFQGRNFYPCYASLSESVMITYDDDDDDDEKKKKNKKRKLMMIKRQNTLATNH